MIVVDTKMPKNCCECDFRCGLNFLAESPTGTGKHPNCPIVAEIPDKHGRLGDLDAIRETVEYSAFWDDSDYNLAIDIIKFAPTILEATE